MTLHSPVPNLRGISPLEAPRPRPGLAAVLSDEGFRLFFPLAALHAAIWPFLWVAVQRYELIGAARIVPAVWHMQEMIFGTFGAALIGFLTTAIPEWTDTRPLRGRALWLLAGMWGVARLVGLIGWDAIALVAAAADLGWILLLIGYAAKISWEKRTDRLLAFIGWLGAFALSGAIVRGWMIAGDSYQAMQAAKAAGLVLLGMLGIALARITVPVTNLVLDPSEETSPFRPHPGRLNLAPGLVAVVLAGQAAGFSDAVTGWLLIAAGAGFMDRVAEGFVGREALRAEIAGLWLPSALSGAGLIWLGAGLLGAPVAAAGGWHLALMGGLGLSVLAVMSIAGLFHSGHSLPLPPAARLAFAALLGSVGLRLAPELGMLDPFPAHLGASLVWAAAFGLWLRGYWPRLSDPESLGKHEGC